MNPIDLQKRAIAYSVLAHIYDKATFANGPLDIFIPIVKHALSKLYSSGTAKGNSISEIADKIAQRFSLSIPLSVLTIILKAIALEVNGKSNREDMRIFNDGSFWIDNYIFEDYSELIQKGEDDINEVIQAYKNFCELRNVNNECTEVDLLKFIDQNRLDLSFYLANNTDDTGENSSHNIFIAQFIDTLKKQFPKVYNKIRDLYLGSMLSIYLDYQPSNVKMMVELLLDTNFIISLLDLNTPESTDTCKNLIKISKDLGYSFTILKDTIEEVQNLLLYKAASYNTAIIAKNINREDIYNACDRRHLTGTDLMRISDNIESTLTNDEYNFNIIPNTIKWHNIAKHSKEYEIFKKYRNTEKAALHDAIALFYVREKRGNKRIKEFEKVNCWFVNNSITQNNDYGDSDYLNLYKSQDYQPEIIKVDNLLNILWLSKPSIKLNVEELSNMGITSLLSSTLNSSLPKARIIKELDENIQKYRSDYKITDKDVINLSTRIVNRQMSNVQVQELNNIANRDGASFATKVKEESKKQEEITTAQVKKLQEYKEAIEELKEIEKREKSDSISLKAEKEEYYLKLQSKWKEENERREQLKKKFINDSITASKKKAKFWCIFLFIFLLLSLWLSCAFFRSTDKETINLINDLLNFRPISIIITIITAGINIFTFNNLYNWYRNPSFIENTKKSLEIPKEYQQITWKEYIEK